LAQQTLKTILPAGVMCRRFVPLTADLNFKVGTVWQRIPAFKRTCHRPVSVGEYN